MTATSPLAAWRRQRRCLRKTLLTMPHPDVGRFLTVPQVAEELATCEVQVIAMLRRGDIRALQLGARRQWRIERAELEAYIQRAYEETEREMQARRDAHDGSLLTRTTGRRRAAKGEPDQP